MEYVNNHKIQQQLTETLKLLQTVLGADLLAVYLYGSCIVGGLQKYSDLDLFVVAARATTPKEKETLVTNLLHISGIYMQGLKFPIEITVVEAKKLKPWHYPPQFDFQYGEWLRASFEKGIIEPWTSHEMPDLALIVTQILLKSETLLGESPEHLLAQVPYHDFMQAMIHELPRLVTDLPDDTRNVLLTYTRIWSTLQTDTIKSKPAAADWAITHLPEIYQPVIKRAKLICIGAESEQWDDIEALIKPCANFMLDQINTLIAVARFNDPNKLIKLA